MVAVRLSPPRGWPECFNSEELQGYIQRELEGRRVRLTERPAPGDAAKIHRLKLKSEDSLVVAQRVKEELGWPIVAGFALYESVEAFSGPYENKFLWGCAADGAEPHTSLNGALVACLNEPTARGVTRGVHFKDGSVAYTLRQGGELSEAKDVTSWLKLEGRPGAELARAYTAEPRYWNAKLNKDGSAGKWVDACPTEHRATVLVESRRVAVPKKAPKAVEERPAVNPLYKGVEDMWYLNTKHHGPLSEFRRSDELEVRAREETQRLATSELRAAGANNLWHTHNKNAPPPPK